MTVENTKRLIVYQGNGSATEFPYDFLIPDADAAVVTLYNAATNTVIAVLDPSEYLITGLGDPDGGEVQYPLVGDPLPSTQKIVIERQQPYVQTLAIPNQSSFFPEEVERAFDRTVMQVQQVAEQLTRTITLPPTATEVDIQEFTAAVLTLAEIEDEIVALAGMTMEISAVYGKLTEIEGVYTDLTGVMNVYSNMDAVLAVDANRDNINAVYANETNINTVAGSISDVNAVAANLPIIQAVEANEADINIVASIEANVNIVAANVADVTAVGDNIAAVVAVYANEANINTVAADLTSTDTIGTVAGSIINVNAVASIDADVATVAGISGNVTTVAGIATDVSTLAPISSQIESLAAIDAELSALYDIRTDITTAAANIADIQAAPQAAIDAEFWADQAQQWAESIDPSTQTPTGSILAFPFTSPPTGWLKANGAEVSRTTYAALFAVIGTTFGVGDGSTTFNLPDLRGEFIRGWDDGRGVDSSRAFGSAQGDQNKQHNHTGTAQSAGAHTHSASTNSTGAHTHTLGTRAGTSGADVDRAQRASGDGTTNNPSTSSAGAHSHTVTVNSGGAHTHDLSINDEGGNEARPRNVALLYCIKY